MFYKNILYNSAKFKYLNWESTLLKSTDLFLWILRNFLEQLFYRTLPNKNTFSRHRTSRKILPSSWLKQNFEAHQRFTWALTCVWQMNIWWEYISSVLTENAKRNICLACLLIISTKSQAQACNFINIIKKDSLAQVFSCEFCKISKNNVSDRTPLGACFCMLSFGRTFFELHFSLRFYESLGSMYSHYNRFHYLCTFDLNWTFEDIGFLCSMPYMLLVKLVCP